MSDGPRTGTCSTDLVYVDASKSFSGRSSVDFDDDDDVASSTAGERDNPGPPYKCYDDKLLLLLVVVLFFGSPSFYLEGELDVGGG